MGGHPTAHALYDLTVLWGPRAAGSAAPLLPSQLIVQLGHRVIPLCLEARAGHRGSQVVLLAEGLHLELAAVVSRLVAEDGLVTVQRLLLLVHQPDVAVQTCAIGRPGAHVVREDSTIASVVPLMLTTRKWCHSLNLGSFLLGASWGSVRTRV